MWLSETLNLTTLVCLSDNVVSLATRVASFGTTLKVSCFIL